MLLTTWAASSKPHFGYSFFRNKLKQLQSTTERSMIQWKEGVSNFYILMGKRWGECLYGFYSAEITWVCFHQVLDHFQKIRLIWEEEKTFIFHWVCGKESNACTHLSVLPERKSAGRKHPSSVRTSHKENYECGMSAQFRNKWHSSNVRSIPTE